MSQDFGNPIPAPSERALAVFAPARWGTRPPSEAEFEEWLGAVWESEHGGQAEAHRPSFLAFKNSCPSYLQFCNNFFPQQPASYAAMSYPGYGGQYGGNGYNYQYGYGDPYAQQQQYQTPPTIRNPFAPPPPAQSAYSKQNANFDPEQEASIAQWQANYAPQDPLNPQKGGKGAIGPAVGPNKDGTTPQISEEKKGMTVMRKGGGKTWEDKTLLEWDPTEFRIQVGNLAGEVTDDSLAKAFEKYGVSKARVIRDKTTTKSRGYGFVSFKDSTLGFEAAKQMAGKYIGSHPVTIQRSKADLRPQKVKEDKFKSKGKKHNHNNNKGNEEKAKQDPLRANTGASIEKKPVRNPGYKLLG